MTKKKIGTWKKERAVGRKYSQSDSHKVPKRGQRKKYWVGDYQRRRKTVKGSFRKNPNY